MPTRNQSAPHALRPAQSRAANGWRGWLTGLAVLAVSLLVLPPSTGFVNAFEPGKQLAWTLLLAVLTLLAAKPRAHPPLWLALGGTMLMLWMAGRTLARPLPFRDLGVLATWLMPLLFCLTAARLNPTDNDHERLGRLLLIAGGIQGTLMLLQRFGFDPFFADTTTEFAYHPARMIGTIGYQNQAAEFLALCLAGGFLLRRMASGAYLLSSLILVAILFTANRGCILGLAVAGITVVPVLHPMERLTRRQGLLLGSAVMLLLLSTVIVAPETLSRFRALMVSPTRSAAVASRVWMARIGIDMIGERPLTGWGAGEYAFQYLDRLGNLLPETKTNHLLESVVYAREAHNDAIQFGAEFGLPALAAAIALLGFLLIQCARKPDCPDDRHASSKACEPAASSPVHTTIRAAGIRYVVVLMAVTSFFSFTWQTSMAGPLSGLLLGWLFGACLSRSGPVKRLVPFLAGFGVVCVLGLMLHHSRTLIIDWRLTRALSGGNLDGAALVLGRYDYRQQALLGAAYAKSGQFGRAETLLTASLLGWRDVLTYNNLGNAFASQRRWRDALPVYEAWVRTGIRHDEALWNLAITHEKLGDLHAAALTHLKKHRLFPEKTQAGELLQTVVLLLKTGELARAHKLLTTYEHRCIRVKTGWTAEWENLAGAILLQKGQLPSAEQRFHRALAMKPSLDSARRNLDALRRAEPVHADSTIDPD